MRKFITPLFLLALISLNAPLCAQEMPLPDDIRPDTLSRLSPVDPVNLDEYGKRIYDKVVGLDNTGPIYGPAAFSVHMPLVAEGMDLINQYLRYESIIGRANIETAILVAAREFDQQYEWAAHEPLALGEGVPQSTIDVIKHHREVNGLPQDVSLIIRYGREILRDHRLSAETWAEAVSLFGQQGALELSAIMADYAMAAIILTAIDQHIPADRPARMPIE
jgi:4-carboxymuconolactone decarboxylase